TAGIKTWRPSTRCCPDAEGATSRFGIVGKRSRVGPPRESTFPRLDCRKTGTNFLARQLMKNFLKFLIFVVLVSLGISLLYDYRMKHGGLVGPSATPEKYSLATAPPVERKEIGTLEEFNRERRTLVSNILPSVVSVKTSKKIAARRQYGLEPFEFFFRNPRQFRNPNE